MKARIHKLRRKTSAHGSVPSYGFARSWAMPDIYRRRSVCGVAPTDFLQVSGYCTENGNNYRLTASEPERFRQVRVLCL